MRAWRVHEYGAHRDVLRLEDAPDPVAPADGVVIDVAAAGLNFPDLLAIAGQYQVRAPRPFSPGFEAAGVVRAVGAASRLRVGDRVVASASWGAFAEQLAVRDAAVLPWPTGLSAAEAASFLVTYQTGHLALTRRAHLAAGETLLVLGAAGGTGLAAIQLGKALGARVLAVAGGADKVAACAAAGADVAIDHRAGDFVAAALAATDGKGVDVIYDPVGGDTTERAMKALAWEGRLLVIGFASGAIPAIKLNRVLLKNTSIVGLYWGAYFERDRALIEATHADLCARVERGELRPVVRTLAMTELPDGLDALAARTSVGNLALAVR
ncbi:MAG: NADPH:quinone oxidoreductase family protein [Myxococcales bacterium]|nr:NADPH:quinone oxidoreductase family protein [Myxococcales bacterium]